MPKLRRSALTVATLICLLSAAALTTAQTPRATPAGSEWWTAWSDCAVTQVQSGPPPANIPGMADDILWLAADSTSDSDIDLIVWLWTGNRPPAAERPGRLRRELHQVAVGVQRGDAGPRRHGYQRVGHRGRGADRRRDPQQLHRPGQRLVLQRDPPTARLLDLRDYRHGPGRRRLRRPPRLSRRPLTWSHPFTRSMSRERRKTERLVE